MKHPSPYALLLVCGTLLCACGDSKAKQEALDAEREALSNVDARSGTDPAPAADRRTKLEFKAQPGWQEETPSSNMRLAQFRLPAAEGDADSPEIAVFFMGGSVQDNLRRWVGQFELPEGGGDPLEENVRIQTRANMRMHTLDVTGKLLADSMGTPINEGGQRMLSTVIEATDGGFPNDGKYFVKLTGPEKTIEKWAASYYALLESL
ncbi:MAG: hypothetical protein GY711_24835 [bacterium]|nr:hypothetical protein [bacterium]